MKLLEKILLPTDLTPAFGNTGAMAIRLAKKFQSEILLMHVIPELQNLPIPLDTVKEETKKHLEEIKDTLQKEGVSSVNTLVEVGSPYDRIVQVAEDQNVNVILMGSGQKAQGDRFPLGITSEKVIRNTTKPVWVAHPESKLEIKTILCPVDFSEASRRALKNAILLSRMFHSELTVLNVIEPIGTFLANLIRWFHFESWVPEETQMDLFLKDFDFQAIRWNKMVRHGNPSEEILRLIKEISVNLLLMGSEGRSGLPGLAMGSVAEKVVREVPCSFITMKSDHLIEVRLEAEVTDMKQHYQNGVELLKQGLLNEAKEQFELCIRKNFMYAPAWESLEEVNKRMGNDQEALKNKEMAQFMRKTLQT